MEVSLLWKKTKTFFGLSIIPNIITEKWGYYVVLNQATVLILGKTEQFHKITPF